MLTKSVAEQLEILIFTYNRAAYLERTLSQFLTSPFAQCRLTVLDNCSTDETPIVCDKYRALFRNLRIVRHKKNIGLTANYLRAVELSEARYTWIIGDDDVYDFSDCADVIAALETKDFDLIYLSDLGRCGWERGMATTSAHLAINGSNYFFLHSFVNNFMFKTERFDSACLSEGYRTAAHLFPQFGFCKKSVRDNFSFYISKKKMIERGQDNNHLAHWRWYAAWVSNCRTIEDRRLCRAAIYELLYFYKNGLTYTYTYIGKSGDRSRWLRGFIRPLILEKLNAPEGFFRKTGQILMGLSLDQLLLFSLLSPLVLTPSAVYRWMRTLRRWARGNPALEVTRSSDPFRS